MEKVSIFVDVQNIYYTSRDRYQRSFDYNKFWRRITENRQVIKANAYAIERGDEKQHQFQNILRGIGFDVRLKPYIQRRDGSAKGDWDVGITIDMLEHAPQSDVIVLASGDGDFDLLVNKVKAKWGARVEVYGVEALSAASLRSAASEFVAIDEELLLKRK